MSTLAEMLTSEHRAIDAAMSHFMAAAAQGRAEPGPLRVALASLRRHIYLEEMLLFPPLRPTGVFAAIIVMLRDHGPMWRLMDQLEPLLADAGTDARVPALCAELAGLLVAHNGKEESTVYAQADTSLDAASAEALRVFLGLGHLPEGWVCAKA